MSIDFKFQAGEIVTLQACLYPFQAGPLPRLSIIDREANVCPAGVEQHVYVARVILAGYEHISIAHDPIRFQECELAKMPPEDQHVSRAKWGYGELTRQIEAVMEDLVRRRSAEKPA